MTDLIVQQALPDSSQDCHLLQPDVLQSTACAVAQVFKPYHLSKLHPQRKSALMLQSDCIVHQRRC